MNRSSQVPGRCTHWWNLTLYSCATQFLRYHFRTRSKIIVPLLCCRDQNKELYIKQDGICLTVLINYIVNSAGQTVYISGCTLLNAQQTVIYFPWRQAGKPNKPLNSPSLCLVQFFIDMRMINGILYPQPVRVHREATDNRDVFVM